MKNNVINLKASRTTDDITSKHYKNGVREVDGVAGFIRVELIEAIQEAAKAFECDYQDLSVGDIMEYLVALEEEFQEQYI